MSKPNLVQVPAENAPAAIRPGLGHRSNQPELLDQPGIPFEDIKQNMRELDRINTLLGGHNITIRGIRNLCSGMDDREWHICETGCGGGDNLSAISRWAKRNGLKVRLTGIDINPHCIRFARERHSAMAGAEWIASDYRTVQFDRKPDIIFSSLFCHHFSDDGVSDIFRWSADHSKVGFFMNDLQRHPLAYHSIALLTRLFSKSYLVKHDAPRSVARGFHKGELSACVNKASIQGTMKVDIHWAWAFRWLLTAKHLSHD